MTTVLADLGGTHLRLARADRPHDISKFVIADYPGLESVLQSYESSITTLYLATAIHPRGGVIEDKRFSGESRWTIRLDHLQRALNISNLEIYNDLEAAAHALPYLSEGEKTLLLEPDSPDCHFPYPPKLLVGIGTGIGHAYLFEKPGHAPFVQRTHGGHIPAMAVTTDQQEALEAVRASHTLSRDLIVEDLVSGHGLANLRAIAGQDRAITLFWEFLGLYCNALTALTGAYGGVYLTGGVMDELSPRARSEWLNSFCRYFRRPMVPVVMESMGATPIYYVQETNMPVAGLSALTQRKS